MTRAFVKDLDGVDPGDEQPQRVVSPHRNLVTPEGLAQIEEEVRRWREAVSAARAADDRAAMLRGDAELRYWSQRQASAELVPASADRDTVRFGATVVLESGDGQRVTYRIVGEDEADPARGKISYVAPLATSLLASKVGDVVEFAGGQAEIVEIG